MALWTKSSTGNDYNLQTKQLVASSSSSQYNADKTAEDLHLIPTETDVNNFVDAALANPDTNNYGAPLDGIQGLSTLGRQKISAAINFSGLPAHDTYDVWIVQWPFEVTRGASTCVGKYIWQDNTGGTELGEFIDSATMAGWASAGLTSSIEVGGVRAYIMAPNTSPFPSNVTGVTGPVSPLNTVTLDYGADVLNGFTRILGANYELIDTTNKLDQQGSSYAAAWDPVTENPARIRIKTGYSAGAFTRSTPHMSLQPSMLPPGDIQGLTSLNCTRTGKAADGIFTGCKIDWNNNTPGCGFDADFLFLGETMTISALPGWSPITPALVVANSLDFPIVTPAVGAALFGYFKCVIDGVNARLFKTGVKMSACVFQNLKPTYSATLERTVVTQSFITPYSPYKMFAKKQHVPCNFDVIEEIINTQAVTEPFTASANNANGSWMRKARGAFKAARKATKALAGPALQIAASSGMPGAAQLNALKNNPQLKAMRRQAKQVSQLTKQMRGVSLKKGKGKNKQARS